MLFELDVEILCSLLFTFTRLKGFELNLSLIWSNNWGVLYVFYKPSLQYAYIYLNEIASFNIEFDGKKMEKPEYL